MLQGAGVKFKTIEALLHGVPVVTTTVGAEGVGADELFVRTVDDAPGLAEALIEVLDGPAAFQALAQSSQAWASTEFSLERFVATVLAWTGPQPGASHQG